MFRISTGTKILRPGKKRQAFRLIDIVLFLPVIDQPCKN